jgi:hypothetical protein
MHDTRSTERHPAPVDDELVAALAEQASADRRSVVRRLAGLPVRGLAGRRIDAAIERHARGEANAG